MIEWFTISRISSMVVAISVAVVVVMIGLPYIERENSQDRIRAITSERTRVRTREREREKSKEQNRFSQPSPLAAIVQKIISSLKLNSFFSSEDGRNRLLLAGIRSPKAETTLLLARFFLPFICAAGAIIYIGLRQDIRLAFGVKLLIFLGAAFVGLKMPDFYLSNLQSKRQKTIKGSLPDALDLMLICVESGMSVENALRKVSTEMIVACLPLGEELALTAAELSYLQERRTAYENLAKRTGIDGIKALTTVFIQAERYGTPLGAALRVISQESRDSRMNDAERKAAALPPKLTIPMIGFFMPALFIVIMTPILIQVFGWK